MGRRLTGLLPRLWHPLAPEGQLKPLPLAAAYPHALTDLAVSVSGSGKLLMSLSHLENQSA